MIAPISIWVRLENLPNKIFFKQIYAKIYEVPREVPIIDLFNQSSIHKFLLSTFNFPTQFSSKTISSCSNKKVTKKKKLSLIIQKTLLVRYQIKTNTTCFAKHSIKKK